MDESGGVFGLLFDEFGEAVVLPVLAEASEESKVLVHPHYIKTIIYILFCMYIR